MCPAGRGLQIGHNDHLEFKPLGSVNGHQLHAAVAVGGRIGQRLEIVEGRVHRGAEDVRLALRQIVESLPEQVEIGARNSVDTLRAAKAQPHLLDPCSDRGCRLVRANTAGKFECVQYPIDCLTRFIAQERLALVKAIPERGARASRDRRRLSKCADRQAKGRTRARAARPARPRDPAD